MASCTIMTIGRWVAPACILLAMPALAAEGESTPFAGTLAQSIAALVVFILLLVFLRKMAWGPILKGLQDRENKIRGDIESAAAANERAQAVLAEYEQKLAAAHAEARVLIDQARSDGDKLRARMTGETEQELARLRDRAADQIEQAKQAAVAELYGRAAELAVAVAGKILQRQITEQDTERLVQQSLSELSSLKNN